MLWSLAIPGGEIQWNRANGASLQLLRQWCHKDKWSYFLLSGTIGFCLPLNENCFCVESRDGAVVRALVSSQCRPGSIPGLGVIFGLSLLFVQFLAPRDFSPGTPILPSPQKPTFPNSNSISRVSPISAPR